ncbi:hypothetical protein [Lampropedia hyalina]|uniref:hypothetical protein n=1 Tax=Lampropedia hyalina TaxID=198706 RepID=UPI0013566778|nr:hypothetical protein [Lampropedia hyalina]
MDEAAGTSDDGEMAWSGFLLWQSKANKPGPENSPLTIRNSLAMPTRQWFSQKDAENSLKII